ncbi:MAG TPA: hypothetical protein VFU47_16365 [Armatimonadota bacterium]|nr:hypothetical protein [Armatimonadota bacterium]
MDAPDQQVIDAVAQRLLGGPAVDGDLEVFRHAEAGRKLLQVINAQAELTCCGHDFFLALALALNEGLAHSARPGDADPETEPPETEDPEMREARQRAHWGEAWDLLRWMAAARRGEDGKVALREVLPPLTLALLILLITLARLEGQEPK